MQGRGRLPRGTTLLAPLPAPLASARSTASRPAREVNFGGPPARGLSVTAPLPVPDGARLLVSVGAGAAILPRHATQRHPAASPTSGSGRSTTAGAPASTTTSPFYVLACEGATGPIIELGAGSGRIAVELARHGHRVIALDASPAMLAQARAARRAPRRRRLLETVVGDLRDPPPLPQSDRVIAPFRTFMHLTGDDERVRGPERRRRPARPRAGSFVFDVFEPSAADIRATHDRWIARAARASASARSGTPTNAASSWTCACPARVVPMTLEWRSAAEWRALCAEAGLTVRRRRSRASAATPWTTARATRSTSARGR